MSEVDECQRPEHEVDLAALEEASSILLSVKINYEKRTDLTVVERELLATMKDWLVMHPPPAGDV